ncbi:MAG: hypothetical protein WDA09_02320 [Bacteriovoracaceae bacterium]
MKTKQKLMLQKLKEEILKADGENKSYTYCQFEIGSTDNKVVLFTAVAPQHDTEKGTISKRMIVVGPGGGLQSLIGKKATKLEDILKEGVKRVPASKRQRKIKI